MTSIYEISKPIITIIGNDIYFDNQKVGVINIPEGTLRDAFLEKLGV